MSTYTTGLPVREVYFALCKSVDTPVSLGAWLRFEYNQTELASMSIRPENYNDSTSFHLDYSVVSLLSKWKGLNTGINLEEVALQSFASSEIQCAETNRRLRQMANVAIPRLHEVFHFAQLKIARLLGDFEKSFVLNHCGWGPGATTDLSRRKAFLDTKMCELPIPVSDSARSLLRYEIERDLHWSSAILGTMPEGAFCLLPAVFRSENECRITTVPKSAKTDRVIAIEPRGNSFLQKGFGGYIRRRLRKVGIDLDDQSVNQQLAKAAVVDGLATLDLRAASDTVSKELVWALLPYDWASAMDACRSRYATMPDKSRRYLEKFSSMGNGFTFELETLIFWALSSAVKDLNSNAGRIAVYGDDIIVPREIADEVVLTLKFCGFDTNETKSFIRGRFFESCGKHYFDGVDVTPAYQKELVDSEIQLIRFGNRLIRLSFRVGKDRRLDGRVMPAWKAAFRHRSHLRWAIPFGVEGDDGWALPYSAFPFRFGVDPNRGVRCRVAKLKQRSFVANDAALLAWSLRRGPSEEPFNGELSKLDEDSQPSDAFRWVIPTGKFSVALV